MQDTWAGGFCPESARFTVDVASIITAGSRRDFYFTSTTIDTATYPTAELRVTETVDLGIPVADETVMVEPSFGGRWDWLGSATQIFSQALYM
ncbi:MAG: hypothetical protein SPI83_03025 [Rothia sp. (in: high G+C Gram-positive bacteria)]|nr:hypothetical protein [Rothia sp. (in: high G+C Gram-positive bacteria)]